MKVFVWEFVDELTNREHNGGGVVVFAETEERARKLANRKKYTKISPEELPDAVRDCENGPEQVFRMPNAGCC